MDFLVALAYLEIVDFLENRVPRVILLKFQLPLWSRESGDPLVLQVWLVLRDHLVCLVYLETQV